MSNTAIKKCSCQHEYQDKKYGVGNRLHNYGVKNSCWRCTVCGSEKAAMK